MKSFIKILSVVLVIMLAVAMFAACGKNDDTKISETEKAGEQPAEDHEHIPGDEFLSDKDYHWNECIEDGEKCNLAEHTIVDDRCNECGLGIVDLGDEGMILTYYDKQDHWVKRVTYKADGSTVEETAENIYNSSDVLTAKKTYKDGKLVIEDTFNDDGSSTQTIYNADGTKTCIENTDLGFAKSETVFDASGNKLSEIIAEFDESGFEIGKKYYENEKLVKEEKKYVVSSDSWGGKVYNIDVTTYNADGTTTTLTYNENFELIEK